MESLINKLDLMAYADQRAGTYSGGNRRKLATALSLIGNPSIVFMVNRFNQIILFSNFDAIYAYMVGTGAGEVTILIDVNLPQKCLPWDCSCNFIMVGSSLI